MNRIASIACALIVFGGSAISQTRIGGLPETAVILESRTLADAKHPNRSLVLWMLSPKRNPRNIPDDEPYTCPDETRGSYYSGQARVSLVNNSSNTIINTIEIRNSEEPPDSIDLPYAIRSGYYYYSPKPARAGAQTRPTIMRLRDYNGDGRALEFALFDALACMGLQTTLIGYSESKDRVVHFPIKLTVIDNEKRVSESTYWADYLFSREPQRLSFWKYEIDYRGRGGSLDKWEVRYNRAEEHFEATVTRISDEPKP
jgi:hypothetical protein